MAYPDHNFMPLLENVQVSLNEILEVRGQALEEAELWGVLFQTTEAVQDIFLRGHACQDGVPQHLVTPDNLLCTAMGRVILNVCCPDNIKGTKFWCSEMMDSEFHAIVSNLEKIYVFTIGQTMLHAAYFAVQVKTQKKLSPLMKTVLQAMCQTDVDLRMVLSDISQVCKIHAAKYLNGISFSKHVVLLHREVLGSLPENEILTQVDQDVMKENEEQNVECEEDFTDIKYDYKYCTYGHRLGYHPEFSAHSKSLKEEFSSSAKERWKSAYAKILKEIRACKVSFSAKEEILEKWRAHKAHQTIFRVYEELTERRKMLELLRLSINIGPSTTVDMDKNPLFMTGLKPKTIAELVLLLQRPSKKPSVGTKLEMTAATEDSGHANSHERDDRVYYAIDKLIEHTPVKWSELKSFPGPEFIIRRLKPHAKISLLSENENFQKSVITVIVSLLNGEHIDIECLSSTSGKQLYQAVADHLKLQERYLFSLAYEDGEEYIFIDHKKEITEFINSASSSATSNVTKLSFRIKFYLDDIHLMRTQTLRHLYFLQLRKNFVKDDFHCENDMAVTLSGFILQAEFGNYDVASHGKHYFLLEHYLSVPCIKQLGRDTAKVKLCSQHLSLCGMSEEFAELKFIQGMMKTIEYGCHFHKVLQDKRNSSSVVWLAVRPYGIQVYENVSGKRSMCQNYPWQTIKRISFSKKYFCLAPHSESHTGKHVVYRFYTAALYRSQYLFNISMSHHKFFLKMKSVSKASEIFIEDLNEEHFSCGGKSGLEKEIGFDLSESGGKQLFDVDRITSYASRLNESNFDDSSDLENSKEFLSLSENLTSASQSFSSSKRRNSPNLVTRSSSAPVSSKKVFIAKGNAFSFKEFNARTSSTIPRTSCGKRVMKLVRLHKDPEFGLGMVITCGNTYETILHGAFVESVYPGSPADLDGNIKPGDQIMSVNGTNVQNDHFLTVVDLIQCSNSPIDLIIAKANKDSSDISHFPKTEINEKPFTKSKAWVVGDEQPKDSMLGLEKIESRTCAGDMPIPKPRKKWTEKGKLSKTLNFDVPDLTINHSTRDKSWEKETDHNIINEHFNGENCSIPDIIASQMKHVIIPKSQSSTDVNENSSNVFNISNTSMDENCLLPGEVYHVVLDKKGGSLGLNIYQGTEPNNSHQRHIYIHSLIANGAAESDGRIKSGDKLLEVNGVILENLSYQEVVMKLRESPQVAHLVLEKGSLIETRNGNEILSNRCDIGASNISQISKSDKSVHDANSPKKNGLKYSGYISQVSQKEIDKSESHLDEEKMFNVAVSSDLYEGFDLDDKNTYSSLPLSTVNSGSSSCSAKETNSAPSSYQHSYKSHFKSNGLSQMASGHVNTDFCEEKYSDDITSSPIAKAKNVNKCKVQHTLTSYQSTPNLVDDSDEEENKNCADLYRNRSTECLLHAAQINPHQALFDLCQNFVRGSSSNIHQMPAVPIRKKKLKKMEDILNYCNSDNTFSVTITKSSRGLGLSISGGRDASRRDLFSQLIQIRKLYPLQPALECGQLVVGDVILEVNGTSMIGLTNTEALEVLRSAPKRVILKIFRPSKSLAPPFTAFKGGYGAFFDSTSSSASSSLSRTETNTYNVETGEFEVTLIKRGGSLGFTISKKENSNGNIPEGIYVKALVREPAVSDGRIQPGDRILQVNGTVVSSMSHSEAIAFIRNTPNAVTLKLFRDDPPLTPGQLEDDYTISKPLRWEAVELLNDRIKNKDSSEESNTLKRRRLRKLDRSSNAPSSSSTDTESNTSSSGQEHVLSENLELCSAVEEMTLENAGLHRNQRPKSLDVLNSSDRKRFSGFTDEDSFHRQSSVMCPNVELKVNESNESNSASTKMNGKNLLKWRGSTLPDSEESSSPDITHERFALPSTNNSSDTIMSSELNCDDLDNDADDDYRPIPFPRTTSCATEWVNTFDVDLDRGWHGRLGFSLCDPSLSPDSKQDVLPLAAEVKAVYPGSLAEKDGRIIVGDRLIEVNRECLLNKSAREVIDILRKTRGVIRMVFCRLEKRS